MGFMRNVDDVCGADAGDMNIQDRHRLTVGLCNFIGAVLAAEALHRPCNRSPSVG